MAGDMDDTIDTDQTPIIKRGTALSTPLIGIGLGIVGAVVMSYSFVSGVNAALNGSGDGATPFIVMFIGAAVLTLIALVIGIVGLVRGGHRILSFLSLLVGLVPVGLVLFLYILQSQTVCCALPPAP
jgi:hypothetical protein